MANRCWICHSFLCFMLVKLSAVYSAYQAVYDAFCLSSLVFFFSFPREQDTYSARGSKVPAEPSFPVHPIVCSRRESLRFIAPREKPRK